MAYLGAIGSGSGGGGGGSSHTYSTTEQVVGTWVNGKPVYEKTYTGALGDTVVGSGVRSDRDVSALNIDTFVSENHSIYSSAVNVKYLDRSSISVYLWHSNGTPYLCLYTTDVEIPNGSIWQLTVRYTKTTDQGAT